MCATWQVCRDLQDTIHDREELKEEKVQADKANEDFQIALPYLKPIHDFLMTISVGVLEIPNVLVFAKTVDTCLPHRSWEGPQVGKILKRTMLPL